MAEITIVGVRSGSKDYTIHIVLTEDQDIEGESPVLVLGEAFLEIAEGTEMADVKTKIIDAATDIMKHHKDAIDKKHDLNELDFPPIV